MKLLVRCVLPLAVACASPHFLSLAASPTAKSVTVPFVLDDNRVFVPLAFILPDGTIRKTLAFVDTGNPILTSASPSSTPCKSNMARTYRSA